MTFAVDLPNLPNCLSNFRSLRLIAARMFIQILCLEIYLGAHVARVAYYNSIRLLRAKGWTRCLINAKIGNLNPAARIAGPILLVSLDWLLGRDLCIGAKEACSSL